MQLEYSFSIQILFHKYKFLFPTSIYASSIPLNLVAEPAQWASLGKVLKTTEPWSFAHKKSE